MIEMTTKAGKFYRLEKTWQKAGDRKVREIREGFMEGALGYLVFIYKQGLM